MTAAHTGVGRACQTSAASIHSATPRAPGLSDITRPSLSHSPGYRAARAAATRPTRSPPSLRPTRPMTTTAATPVSTVTRRCQSSGVSIQLTGASSSVVTGPCSAAGRPVESTNHPPSASAMAVWL
jgi:hypothetical protein